ncbi:hypothetical protein B0H63DRAFT_558888 [Podospora didyma]|uniref:GRF-like zinc ribbon domain-containing protein n=1 Tax=Podospora didyma TaxID=330526 RepID=A0AAE0NTD1_9PEZI|nr:hypothetical protein B0H63DRAFT_558888 [Podospora didyma]
MAFPAFPLPQPPRCLTCGQPCTPQRTKPGNLNGNQGRNYYICFNPQHESHIFSTFDDNIGIGPPNPLCRCGYYTRRSFNRGGGGEFFTCPVGVCPFKRSAMPSSTTATSPPPQPSAYSTPSPYQSPSPYQTPSPYQAPSPYQTPSPNPPQPAYPSNTHVVQSQGHYGYQNQYRYELSAIQPPSQSTGISYGPAEERYQQPPSESTAGIYYGPAEAGYPHPHQPQQNVQGRSSGCCSCVVM